MPFTNPNLGGAGARHEVFRDASGRAHVSNLAALPLSGAADFARALGAASARRGEDAGGPRGTRPPRHGAATFVVTLLVARPGTGAPFHSSRADMLRVDACNQRAQSFWWCAAGLAASELAPKCTLTQLRVRSFGCVKGACVLAGGPPGKLSLVEVAGGSVAAAASAAGSSTAGRTGAAVLRQRLIAAAAGRAAVQRGIKGKSAGHCDCTNGCMQPYTLGKTVRKEQRIFISCLRSAGGACAFACLPKQAFLYAGSGPARTIP